MRVRMLKVGVLEIPLDELEADVLEIGVLRIVHGDTVTEYTLAPRPGIATRCTYDLTNSSFMPNRFVLPGGPAAEAQGTGSLSILVDGSAKLVTSVVGVRRISLDGAHYESWLIHDLRVPADLDDADLAALPRGADGLGNARGAVFTLDGARPSTTGTPSGQPNTVWVPISAGAFNTDEDGAARTSWDLSPQTNWTFSLLELLGFRTGQGTEEEESARDPDNPRRSRVRLMPSGIAGNILTDAFMRPASVLPELTLEHHFARRLVAIYCSHVRRVDGDGDGVVVPGDVATHPECFIDPRSFGRMAITREVDAGLAGLHAMPSQKAFVLATAMDGMREG